VATISDPDDAARGVTPIRQFDMISEKNKKQTNAKLTC
jgi:hypothetical protein